MNNDDLKIKDGDKMRLHYRKRSAKNGSFAKQKSNDEVINEQITPENASKDELDSAKSAFEFDDSDSNVRIGKRNKKGNLVFVDPASEKKRNISAKFEKGAIYTTIIAVAVLMAFLVLNWFSSTSSGQKIISDMNNDKHITEDGNYIFGSFDGYVTIGTSLDDAIDILGLPTPGSQNQYFYGNSYILVENDVVVGYHKDASDYFQVTIGYRNEDTDPIVKIGDRAKRVVSKLGSPTTYQKNVWIYENMNRNFTYNYYSSNTGTNLIILFDENYLVTGYEFIDK